jgi:hypothetical protein
MKTVTLCSQASNKSFHALCVLKIEILLALKGRRASHSTLSRQKMQKAASGHLRPK